MITFSDEFLAFISIVDATITRQSVPQGHDEVTIAWRESSYEVHAFGGLYSLASSSGATLARDAHLAALEKMLAMEIGPVVRQTLGLPPEGYLPDIFALAPGVARVNDYRPHLNWQEDGEVLSLQADDGHYSVTTLNTYRSQYLRHPLRAIIDSFTLDGPGIFTDEAPEAPRPFRLPARTHDWLTRSLPEHWQMTQSVFYDNPGSGGIRITVVNGGYRIDRRQEKSNGYVTFEAWIASLEALQVYLMWENHYAWSPGWKTRRFLRIPDVDVLAPGFTIERVEPNNVDNWPVRLLRDGVLQAVMFRGSPGWDGPVLLSRLLTIGLDMLELSILNVDGAPALTTD